MRKRPVDDVLETVVTLAEAALVGATNEETAIAREEAAYQAMHDEEAGGKGLYIRR